ncbi:MAG: glycosyltransferase family 2 protein [Pseudomonadota bacterium]
MARSLSIAICTHNRPDDVTACLRGLQSGNSENFPIYVIDSGSDPDIASRLKQMSLDHKADYVRCDEPGLSRARNKAHELVQTDWIVFLDDDAVVRSDWGRNLQRLVDDAADQVAIIGGRVVPSWPDEVDVSHITDRWMLLLSCVDIDGRGHVAAGMNVCGANLAFRQSALKKVDGFPLSLGRVGTKLISGEES